MAESTSVVKGAVLTVTMRWLDRLIGVASTLILARLLIPDDFGIIAQASLVIGLLGVLTDLGVQIALIQRRELEQSHWDTAWTIRLGQYLLLAAVIALGAPLAGEYFGDPRVVPVLQLLTVMLILAGVENIGIVAFQKEMQFGQDFRFLFLRRVAGFVATITLAVLWRDYWAMVAGMIVGRVVGVTLSYTMHPMRPRLSLARFGDIFSVSQWALLRSAGEYLDANLDRFLIGARANTSTLGGYSVANEIAMIPSTELLMPLNRVLFPAFVKAKEDLGNLKRMFLLAQGVQTLVAIPAAVGLALVAPEAIRVLLGDEWSFAAPFLQVLALIYVVRALTASSGYVLITMDEIRSTALIYWIQVGVFALLAIALLPSADATQIAQLRLLTGAFGLTATFWLLRRVLPQIGIGDIVSAVYRPLLAAGVMALVLSSFDDFGGLRDWSLLMIKVVLGALVYVLVVLGLWQLHGRPAAAESYLLEKLTALRRGWIS